MKWTVGTKIGLAFALALTILAGLSAISYRSTNKLIETADWVTHTYKVLEDLANILQSTTDAETGVRGYVITGEDNYLEPYRAGIAVSAQYLNDLQELTRDNPAQQPRIAELREIVEKRTATLKELVDLQKTKGADTAKQSILTGMGKQEMDAIRKLNGEMRETELALLKERSDESQASAAGTKATIVLGTGCAMVVMAIIGFLLSRNISNPLKQMTQVAEQIAGGDLSGTVAASHRRDEVGILAQMFSLMTESLQNMAQVAGKIGEGDLRVTVKPQSERDVLGNAFASMVENLQQLTSQVTEGVSVLSVSANQISTSTSQLSSSAAETATAVSQTTTTVEEVRQTAQLSSQKSKAVSDSAQTMTQITRVGTKATDDTVAGIQRIRQQMSAIADNMVRLSEQSQTIGQIVTTVEDLATQSNILAVNASIEAAKAGEHGKGFAVVAQEVRSLAEQSKQATGQVRGILNDIQKATTSAVMATEQGTKAVEAGVKQATEAGQSIQSLSNSVSEGAQAATQIAASSQQQLIGVDQVASAMENIKQASSQNVTSARQLESAAHSLKELGEKLKTTVTRYKI